MRSAARILRLPLGLTGAVVLLTYGAIVWTLPRGFDWTDEAFIYTMIASNRVAAGEPWGFQHLLHPLYVLTGQSVLVFRVLRLAGYVGLSLALVGGARAVAGRLGMRVPRAGWVFVLLLAQVGTFLAWSYPAHHLGYNEVAAWFAQLGAALIVISLAWGISVPDASSPSPALRDRRVLWSVWAGLGAVSTLLVFTKVTSGLALWALVTLALVMPGPVLRRRERLVAAAAGTTLVLLVLGVCRYPMVAYLRNVSALLLDTSAQEAFDHPVSEVLDIYGRSLLLTGRALVPALLLFVLAMATFHRRARLTGEAGWSRAADAVTWTLGSLLLIAVVVLPRMVAPAALTRFQMWSYVGVLAVFTGAAGFLGMAILGADGAVLRGSAANRIRSLSVGLAAAVIALAPLISAVGTNNRLAGEFGYAATLWAVLLGFALVRLTQRATLLRSRARILPSLVGCAVVLMAGLAVRADIAKPYRTAPLMSQGTSTSVPELRGLLLTKGDAAWIGWVDAAGDSLGARDVPATAIDAPGALFAFNHSGYANPWLGHQAPVTLSSLRLACTSNPPSDLFVLQPGTQPGRSLSTAGLTRSLAACGLRFPGDFRVVDQRASARPRLAMTIWRLKGGWRPAQGAAR